MKYKFLEHTADQYIRAFGKSLAEAFENGGLAVFDTLTDITKVASKTKKTFKLYEEELESLLYSYIEELLVTWEINNILFSEIHVKIRRSGKGYKLWATIFGEEFNPEKHPQRVGVKAMTYCLMKIDNTPPNVIIEFVVDI